MKNEVVVSQCVSELGYIGKPKQQLGVKVKGPRRLEGLLYTQEKARDLSVVKWGTGERILGGGGATLFRSSNHLRSRLAPLIYKHTTNRHMDCRMVFQQIVWYFRFSMGPSEQWEGSWT